MNKGAIIKWSITIILPALILCIPLSDVFTSTIRMFFAITVFVMAIIACGFFDMAVLAFLLPALYILMGVAPASTVFAPWSGSTTMYMIIGAFLYANVLNECGLLKRISYWTIRKLGGSYNGMVYAIFIAGLILATLTFNNGYILEVFLTASICLVLELKKGSKEAAIICCAGALGAYGLAPYTYYPAENGIISTAVAEILPNIQFTWFTRLYYAWPLLLTCFLTLWILTKIYKTKHITVGKGIEYFNHEYEKLGPLSAEEKRAVRFSVILGVYLVTQSIHKLPADYIFMVLPWLMIVPKIGVGTKKSVDDIYLGVVFFISSCMAIGTVGVSIGLGDLISKTLTPHLIGLHPLALMYAFLGVGSLANFALTPFAMLSGLSAPFCQIAMDLGLDPMFSLMSLITSTATVFMPHEVTCYVVLFSFGYITMGDFIKTVGLYSILTLIVIGMVVYPWWCFIGLI